MGAASRPAKRCGRRRTPSHGRRGSDPWSSGWSRRASPSGATALVCLARRSSSRCRKERRSRRRPRRNRRKRSPRRRPSRLRRRSMRRPPRCRRRRLAQPHRSSGERPQCRRRRLAARSRRGRGEATSAPEPHASDATSATKRDTGANERTRTQHVYARHVPAGPPGNQVPQPNDPSRDGDRTERSERGRSATGPSRLGTVRLAGSAPARERVGRLPSLR